MWLVAVFAPGQHEQFCTDRERFSLSRRGEHWQLDRAPSSSNKSALRVRIVGDSAIVDARGVADSLRTAEGDAFSSSVPLELPLPCLFQLGDAWFDVRACEPTPAEAVGFGLELLQPAPSVDGQPGHALAAAARGPEADTVARWLAAVGKLHRMAASSPEFFDSAARIALDSTGLDAAMILTRGAEGWQIAGSAVSRPEHGVAFEPSAVAVVEHRPLVWRRPPPTPGSSDQAQLRESIVVAPVFDEAGQIAAAVYGVRHSRGDNRRRGIRTLEARVIELMADAVTLGLARRRQEIESARQQVLLEQAFSPTVVEHLRRRPEALAGQTRETSLLFADLRGFTAIAADMPPAESYDLLAEVLESFTQAILEHEGVVIDYFGDGVSALWNAPLDTPGHADLACRAALEMIEALPTVSRRWKSRLARPLEVRVGVHTGKVQVGNAGTERRLKYGPRGSHVNLASRIQSAAKHLDVSLLVTDAVRRRLSTKFVTLKVCTARLPGFDKPIELFTALPATDGRRLQQDLDQYAAALRAFERGDLDEAEQSLAELLAKGPATPAAFLAQQTAALRQGALGRRVTDKFGCTPDAVIEILAK